ncbi:glycine zipper 2TM domain-containing protein [Candidatus Dactylopiibacterium carminicum]|nr:glycine zipper 2TM domain-containing protein [Candidatus Dactylopiibacterium carminicum]
MKRILMTTMLACVACASQAAEYGKVISSTPIMETVSTPQRVCRDEQVAVPAQRSADGSIMGAIAGGLLGSTMGEGSGKTAATAAGVIVGAVVGDQAVNGDARGSTQTVRRCGTRYVKSQQLVGYDVEYEYAGKYYRTRTTNDPGDSIALSVTPLAGATSAVDEEEIIYDDVAAEPRRDYVRPSVMLNWSVGGGDPGPHHHRR